jgi:hypothetical protein
MPEMSEQFLFDVFPSHSSIDKSVVRAVTERLRTDRLQVQFDEWELKPIDRIPVKKFCSARAQLESHIFWTHDSLNRERSFFFPRFDDVFIDSAQTQTLCINNG